jgi:hypothetical protein
MNNKKYQLTDKAILLFKESFNDIYNEIEEVKNKWNIDDYNEIIDIIHYKGDANAFINRNFFQRITDKIIKRLIIRR